MLTCEQTAPGVVLIAGRLDAAQAAVAQNFLDALPGTVTLDCTALEYISSAGLGVLLKTQKRLKSSGGELRLTKVSQQIFHIFALAGFDQIFRIEAA